MAVNLDAPFLLGQRFGPAMARRRFGRIIHISSQQAHRAFFHSGAYGVSIGGLEALTRPQAEGWSRDGVTCNPRLVMTPLNARLSADPATVAALAERTLIGRNGLGRGLRGIAVFVAGHASGYVTGQSIFIDGRAVRPLNPPINSCTAAGPKTVVAGRSVACMGDYDFDEFLARRADAARAYVSGDPAPLGEIVARVSPATFFGPRGGHVRGTHEVSTGYERDAAVFGPDSVNELEILDQGAGADIAYWVGFQRSTARVAGKPTEFNLRVTEIFRREDGEWKLVHRHADPLAEAPGEQP